MFTLIIELDSTLITAIVTAIVTVGLFIVKEAIENARNRRKSKQQKIDTFRAYTDPLKDASILLYERLMEIFENKAKFLYRQAPKNPYNQYRYISTLYRLCVVLGWVRATKKELAGVDLEDARQLQNIDASINAFQQSLFDNQFMEGERVRFLMKKWDLEHLELEDEEKDRMSEEIAQYIWGELAKHDKVYARQLDDEKQLIVLRKIAEMICTYCNSDMPHDEVLSETHRDVIRAISRTEAWIYRDWQVAIGEIMLEEVSGVNALRNYQVRGFETFEDMYLEYQQSKGRGAVETEQHQDERFDEHVRNRWIGRIDRLFKNLNMNSMVTHDARIQQLRNVGSALLVMIEQLEKLVVNGEYQPSEQLKTFKEFDRTTSNPDFYAEIEIDPGPSEAATSSR